MNKYIVSGIAIIAAVVGLVIGYFVFQPRTQNPVGSVGVKLAENYDPYLKYNGGYYSNLPIYTTGKMEVDGISTQATTSVTGGLCVYNGSNFTLIEFGSNSTTTTSFATSTTCF